jgi:hypothetical protein
MPGRRETEVRNRRRSSGNCRASDRNCERAETPSGLSVHMVPLLASYKGRRESREGSQMTDLSHLFGNTPVNLKGLRARLRKMSDNELQRFGRAVRNMCTPEANLGK